MFQTIDESKPRGSLRERLIKVVVFIAGVAALGGIVYFFAFTEVAR